ncbi:helix-turn-helix domain-containing protein [Belnapia sp. T18]|uniref:Helix-turn-helix domain-containing protein n=1 Tax=Belnapia arida TaxID=2804533 RepID=A0ABS1U9H0_9PROT|nr:helix-turn-helix domain-containing protein [Belnapia arida]
MKQQPRLTSRTVSRPTADAGPIHHATPEAVSRRYASRATGPAAVAAAFSEPPAQQPETLRQLFTIVEVCRATGFSDSTVRRAIRLRHLAAITVGRSVRLTQVDVDAWLDRNHRKPR